MEIIPKTVFSVKLSNSFKDRFLTKEYAVENHSKGPDIHSCRVVLEFIEDHLRGDEGMIQTVVREVP